MRRKTAVLTVRVTPEVKSALKAAAARERRSQANLVECLVLDYASGTISQRRVSGDTRTKWVRS